MTHCKGCGGQLGATSPSYGHILGCGSEPGDDHVDHAGAHEHHGDHRSYWRKADQEKILQRAFKAAGISVTQTQLKDFADKLGDAIRNYP